MAKHRVDANERGHMMIESAENGSLSISIENEFGEVSSAVFNKYQVSAIRIALKLFEDAYAKKEGKKK